MGEYEGGLSRKEGVGRSAAREGDGVRGGGAGDAWGDGAEEEAELTVLLLSFQLPGRTALRDG